MKGIHLCAVLLSGTKRTGLACRVKHIPLPNWLGVFEGGGWPSIHDKFEWPDDNSDKEDEDVSLNVIDDVQQIKKNGTANQIHFWRQVAKV